MRIGSILTLFLAASGTYGTGFLLWKLTGVVPPTCVRLFPGQEPVTCYATPEGAALAAYFDEIQRVTRYKWGDTIHLNVPPTSKSATEALAMDLRRLASQISIVREASDFAHTVISEDSVKTLGFVWDVRRAVADPFSEPGMNYSVASEACRSWPCHGGAGVEVRRMLSGHFIGRIRYTWVE